MPPRRRSFTLSLRNAGEALAISAPTVIDALRSTLSEDVANARLARFGARIVRNAAMQVEVVGRENVRAEQTYVVMSNHQSHYDVPVLYAVIGGNMRMVAKKELFRVPVFGRAMRAAGFIEVDRKRPERAIASLEIAKTRLGGGMHIWIAPEGTRSETGALLPFKKGGFVIALDTGMPVLPISIRGTRDALPAHGKRTLPGACVRVTVHPAIDVAPFAAMEKRAGREALLARVREAIGSAI